MKFMDKKLNCWEFKKCGIDDKCPAASSELFDGINGGKSAGRVCWTVVGTLCRGCVQTDLALKYHDCIKCDFFDYVRMQEGNDFNIFDEVYKRGLVDQRTCQSIRQADAIHNVARRKYNAGCDLYDL